MGSCLDAIIAFDEIILIMGILCNFSCNRNFSYRILKHFGLPNKEIKMRLAKAKKSLQQNAWSSRILAKL